MTVPESHPRYESLRRREKIIEGIKAGIVADAGLIAHGRGEAFDYLLGERTVPGADLAERITAYHLLLARHPVLSVNGNTAVLVPDELVALSHLVPAVLEINLFYRSEERVSKIAALLKEHGAQDVMGEKPDATIPGLDHMRAHCTLEGTMKADVILIPLEDGDRAQALKSMGKTTVTIDLNPLSRTSQVSDVTIVDDVVRAIPNIIRHIKGARNDYLTRETMEREISNFDNKNNLYAILELIRDMK